MDLGETGRAIADYDSALRLRPDDGNGYLNRSKAYFRTGAFGKALEDYDRASRNGVHDEGYRDALHRHTE